MGRPKKIPTNLGEEIEKLDMQVIKWQNTIAELKERRSELVKMKKESEVAELLCAIEHSGKSVGEVAQMLAQAQPDQ